MEQYATRILARRCGSCQAATPRAANRFSRDGGLHLLHWQRLHLTHDSAIESKWLSDILPRIPDRKRWPGPYHPETEGM